MDLIFNKSVK